MMSSIDQLTADGRLKISRLFPYKNLLKLGRERDGAIFLDIGCCCKFRHVCVMMSTSPEAHDYPQLEMMRGRPSPMDILHTTSSRRTCTLVRRSLPSSAAMTKY